MTEKKLWDVLQKLRDTCIISEEKIRSALHLTHAEYFAVGCMRSEEKINCRELAKRMGLSLSRCSRIVDRLHEKGFIAREDCVNDRRCRELSLSPKGLSTKKEIDKLRDECETRLSQAYPGDKLKVLFKDLEGLVQRLEESNRMRLTDES
jgi:DNA-binding MarR family transcriptional regulator